MRVPDLHLNLVASVECPGAIPLIAVVPREPRDLDGGVGPGRYVECDCVRRTGERHTAIGVTWRIEGRIIVARGPVLVISRI